MIRVIFLSFCLFLGSCISTPPEAQKPNTGTQADPIGLPPSINDYQWDHAIVGQSHPVERYLEALKLYHERLTLYIEQLQRSIDRSSSDKCSQFIPFPTPDLKPVPESIDLSNFDNEEEAYIAFGEYTQALYDYATRLRNIYIEDVARYNDQCLNK